MFRHCVYDQQLRAQAPLTVLTNLDFEPFNRRGDGLFIVFRLTGSLAGGTYTVQMRGSFDRVTYFALGSANNFLQSIGSGNDGSYIFNLSGALPPFLRVQITPVGFPSGDVSVVAKGSVGVTSAGTGYRPQDYVPPHTHGFADGLTDFPIAFPLKSIARGIVLNPNTGAAAFAVVPDMTLTLTPPTAAINVRRWEATLVFTGGFSHSLDGGTGRIRFSRDGLALSTTTRPGGAGSINGEFTMACEDVRSHDAGVSHTYAVEWSNPGNMGLLTAIDDNRIFTVEFRPVA